MVVRHIPLAFLCGVLLLLSATAGSASSSPSSFSKSKAKEDEALNNPLSPKSFLVRYWNYHIANTLPKPNFLLSKASPLSPSHAAALQSLADRNSLSSNLPYFCRSANLFCFPDLSPSLAKYPGDAQFSVYSSGRNFTNYGTFSAGGVNTFKNYSDNDNLPINSFRQYGRNAAGHVEKFSHYAPDGNVGDGSFASYGSNTGGGASDFFNYDHAINVPNLRFGSYSSSAAGRTSTFVSYSDDSNAGDQSFRSYGKKGAGPVQTFTSYGKNSNVVGSSFTHYSPNSAGGVDNFTSYGTNGNVPQNNFRFYGEGKGSDAEIFSNYRDQANVGDDSFVSYEKNDDTKVEFNNYGQSFNEGTDMFKGYSKGTGFKTYGVNNTFKDYANKSGISFARYTKRTTSLEETKIAQMQKWVEPGKFFRETMLKQGTVMPMPDIRDKMPPRSFLPRKLASKLPFSANQVSQLKEIFQGKQENSTMGKILEDTLRECERDPSKGETKKCVASIEDMIDFATSVLGRDVTVKSTESVAGSKGDIEIGKVVGLNGGRITKSVSCHQSLFPYMVYFCHSVPKVRVYEAEILEAKTKQRINRGVAICHIDTTMWGERHGAFLALGGKPGQIEVCHWIFENDMTWVVSGH